MRWNKLRKIIIEHPYMISDDFHMSMQQAKEIQEQEGYRSFEEMVESARRRSPLPDSAWQGVYAVINKQESQVSMSHSKLCWMPDRRQFVRWAIIGLSIILVTGYFTLIPSGKALAASIAEIIIEVFDDGFRFRPAYLPAPSQEKDTYEESVVEFMDYAAAQKQIGRPLIRFIGDSFRLDTLKLYEGSSAGSLLDASYYTQEGLHITLQQEWNISGAPWVELDTAHTWEETLGDEVTLCCYIDTADDNKFIAIAEWKDCIITIYADDGVSYQEIVSALHIPE